MGRLGITYEQVEEAAENILASGQNPTIDKVRRSLGDTGSNSSISHHLSVWKKERLKIMPRILEHRNLSLPDSLSKAVADILEKVRAESEEENSRIRKEAEELADKAINENSVFQEKIAVLQTNLEQTQNKLSHLQAECMLVNQTLIDERRKNAVLNERVNQYEKLEQRTQEEIKQRLVELNRSHAEMVEYLKNELNNIQKTYQKELNGLKEQNEKQRQKYIVEIDQLKVAKGKAETSHLKSASELAQQQKQNTELKERIRGLETDLKVLEQENQQLKHDNHESEKQVVMLKAAMNQKEIMIRDLKEQLSTLTQKLISKSERSQ